MKRISLHTLRQKKWFKYLKIGYLAAFAVSLLFVMKDSFSILEPKLDKGNSYVLCDNGQKYTLGSHGMEFSGSQTLTEVSDREAKQLCVSDERLGELARANMSSLLAKEKLTDAELGKRIKEGSGYAYQNIYWLLPELEHNYKVVEVYTHYSLFTKIAWLVLPSLVLVAIFELELRIFYYLVLGRFLPDRPVRYLFFKVRY